MLFYYLFPKTKTKFESTIIKKKFKKINFNGFKEEKRANSQFKGGAADC